MRGSREGGRSEAKISVSRLISMVRAWLTRRSKFGMSVKYTTHARVKKKRLCKTINFGRTLRSPNRPPRPRRTIAGGGGFRHSPERFRTANQLRFNKNFCSYCRIYTSVVEMVEFAIATGTEVSLLADVLA
jgi:hypothetical protein